jgi:putative ATP-dependent endonuclease of OLD family
MKISKLKLKNFKCFGPNETVIYLSDISAIIGANNSGKSAVLLSLQRLFGMSNRERDIQRSDFHIPKGKKPENLTVNDLTIEAIIEFPELLERDGASSVSVPELFERMVIDSPEGHPYVRIRLEASWERGNSPEGNIDSKLFFITAPENDPNEDEEENKTPISSHHRSAIQVLYVPAIREPALQLKHTTGTILWRILNGINWPDEAKKDIADGLEAVNSLLGEIDAVKHIQETISTHWKSYHKDARYSDAKIKFNSTDLDTILKKLDVEFYPTEIPGSYSIEYLGEGLRSLFYFTLVNSLLEIEEHAIKEAGQEEKLFNMLPPALTLLAIEEPENHISPHILGKVVNNLISISEKNNAQVLLTSHTPSIVKRINPESICHLRIDSANNSSIASRIILPDKYDEAYKFVKEAVIAYPELYFSRLVVLGEGDTESIIIPKALETLGSSIDSSGISVVPLGGRHVNHFWRLLSALNIPYITLLDLDLERSGGGWGRIKYVLKELIQKGVNKKILLKLSELSDGKILSDEDLDNMHSWSIDSAENRKNMGSWAKYLEEHNVIFSSPLDLDFAMLSSFTANYMATAPDSGGPQILSNREEYKEKLTISIQAALKGGEGKTYVEAEKELMIWYVYLFLYRGKPSTHILALKDIDAKAFKSKMPSFLQAMLKRVKKLLKDDPFSALSEG